MGSNRSSSLRIYASPPADVDSDLSREVPSRLIVVNPPNAPAAPPPPLEWYVFSRSHLITASVFHCILSSNRFFSIFIFALPNWPPMVGAF